MFARDKTDITQARTARKHVYSVGITVPVEDIERPFNEIEDEIEAATEVDATNHGAALLAMRSTVDAARAALLGALARAAVVEPARLRLLNVRGGSVICDVLVLEAAPGSAQRSAFEVVDAVA
ncbi:MAG: hypothetical protein VX152_12440, partial [Pseudomonadota bacterium]|nr:hypothetical protein [Pseudomonadota bacterium]